MEAGSSRQKPVAPPSGVSGRHRPPLKLCQSAAETDKLAHVSKTALIRAKKSAPTRTMNTIITYFLREQSASSFCNSKQRGLSLLWLLLLVGPLDAAETDLEADFKARVQPLVTKHCLGCHSTAKHKGDLDLERFSSMREILKNPKPWEAVIEQIELGEMPPKDESQKSDEGYTHLLANAPS